MMTVATFTTAELLGVMTRLTDLLAQETALLRAGRVGEIAPLQSDKVELSARCAAAIKALNLTPGAARSLPAEVRAQLTATGGRFAAAAQENAEALRIGGAATRLLLQMVIESVEAQRRPLSGYTARLAPTRAASLLAVALDRHL